MHTIVVVIVFWIGIGTTALWLESKVDSLIHGKPLGNFHTALWSIAITCWTVLFWKLHVGW